MEPNYIEKLHESSLNEDEIIDYINKHHNPVSVKFITFCYTHNLEKVIKFIIETNRYKYFNEKLISIIGNDKDKLIIILNNAIRYNPYFKCSPKLLLKSLVFQKELLETRAFDYKSVRKYSLDLTKYNANYTIDWIKREEDLENSARMRWITACIITQA